MVAANIHPRRSTARTHTKVTTRHEPFNARARGYIPVHPQRTYGAAALKTGFTEMHSQITQSGQTAKF